MIDLATDHQQWLKIQLEKKAALEAKANPNILRYGAGPDWKSCRSCRNISFEKKSKTLYKCEHFLSELNPNYKPCGKYEEKL
jgi:hypothetical protein